MGSLNRPADSRCYWYLLFWPFFGLRYLLIERYHPSGGFHEVSCWLDSLVPFWEGFVIPYFSWHVCAIGLQLWLCFRDEMVFRRYSRYLLISMGISTTVFLLWPTCQNLRPQTVPRHNLLTDAVQMLYRMDTNTNVCPSEHVIGAVGFFLASMDSEKIRIPGKRFILGVAAILMATATVFLKQHSVVDVLAALPVCLTGYLAAFCNPTFRTRSWGHSYRRRFSA